MPPLPAIDPEAIANLRALSPDDDDVFLKEIITIFLEDTPIRLKELNEGLKEQKIDVFVRSAHSIKGSASNVGAMELRALAEFIEHHGRQNGSAGTEPKIVELEAAFQRAREALEEIANS
jgi:histidine phosphotransfer protein HptB